jgi:hypothetical protein
VAGDAPRAGAVRVARADEFQACRGADKDCRQVQGGPASGDQGVDRSQRDGLAGASSAASAGGILRGRTSRRRETLTKSRRDMWGRIQGPTRPIPIPNAKSFRVIPQSSFRRSPNRSTDRSARKSPMSRVAGNNDAHTTRGNASLFRK